MVKSAGGIQPRARGPRRLALAARGPRPGCGPTRRVAGPPGRPENAQQKERPAVCKNQSTGGAGVLQGMQQQG